MLKPQTWLENYGDFLYRYARQRVADRQVAEDLVQEAFVGALSAIDRYSGDASERTWLVGILRHKIVDHYRRAGQHPTASASDPDPDPDPGRQFFDRRGHWKRWPARWAADPESRVEQDEFWAMFHECVSKLPQRLGDAYRLREISRLDGKEVCDLLGITPTNLWTQLHRARLLLRQCLEINWFQRGRQRGRK